MIQTSRSAESQGVVPRVFVMQQSSLQRAALYCRSNLDDPNRNPPCGDSLAYAARGGHGMSQEPRAKADDTRAAIPALALAMGLHELAANALKYGALSPAAPESWVELRWAKSGGRMRVAWPEHGGPSVTPPSRRGFGTRFVERYLAQDLGGTAGIAFDPEGVTCTVDAPRTEAAASAEAAAFLDTAGRVGP